jgi:hypothetical protein
VNAAVSRRVLVFHGGHARACLALGEEVFAAASCTLLAPSRPGYRRTPLSTGRSVHGYTDVVPALCADLGITRVGAVAPSATPNSSKPPGYPHRLARPRRPAIAERVRLFPDTDPAAIVGPARCRA